MYQLVIFFQIHLLFGYVVCMCTTFAPGAQEAQKNSSPLELKLHMPTTTHMHSG